MMLRRLGRVHSDAGCEGPEGLRETGEVVRGRTVECKLVFRRGAWGRCKGGWKRGWIVRKEAEIKPKRVSWLYRLNVKVVISRFKTLQLCVW
jgi:hypothetical protein